MSLQVVPESSWHCCLLFSWRVTNHACHFHFKATIHLSEWTSFSALAWNWIVHGMNLCPYFLLWCTLLQNGLPLAHLAISWTLLFSPPMWSIGGSTCGNAICSRIISYHIFMSFSSAVWHASSAAVSIKSFLPLHANSATVDELTILLVATAKNVLVTNHILRGIEVSLQRIKNCL